MACLSTNWKLGAAAIGASCRLRRDVGDHFNTESVVSNKPKNDDPLVVTARPTKALFIDMLTRDIGLVPAIIDLVDKASGT